MAHGQQPAANLAEHVDRLIESLRKRIPGALRKWEADDIHQSRVSTRRLKAALELLEPQLPKRRVRPFARALRHLRRSLGPLRDMDVLIGHLLDLHRSGAHRPAIAWLARRLHERRRKLRKSLRKEARPRALLTELEAWNAMEKQVAGFQDRLPEMLKSTVGPQLDSVKTRAAALGARQSGGVGKGEDVHALRIAGKQLRYTLEMFPLAGWELAPNVLPSFKKLQDALGLWHDFIVLSEQAVKVAAEEDLALHDRTLYGQVLALALAAWKESERQLSLFGRLWAVRGAALERQIRKAAGLTARSAPAEGAGGRR